jgi:hypothetical protein
MNSEKLNKWLTLGANLGVFAGLVLVAYEINQSATNLDLAVSSDGVDNFQQAMEILVQDEDLARLIFRAETSFEELDEFDKWRVSKYLDGYFSMSEQDFRVLVSMSEDGGSGFVDDWRENMALPMYQDYWSHSEGRFTRGFRQFINDTLTHLGDP